MPRFWLVLLYGTIAIATTSAQLYRSTLAAGYTATFLVNSPATNLIFVPSTNDSAAVYVTGSRFVGAQSGITLRFTPALDHAERWFLPISLDAIFFRGKQRLENQLYLGRGEVDADVYSAMLGVQYRYADLPLAQAFLYASLEPRLSIVGGPHFSYVVSDRATGVVYPEYSIDTTLKPTVVRFGGQLRLGAQGVLQGKVLINVNVSYGIFNLIGRDTRTTDPARRANLLTPTTINQTSEAYEHFVQFGLWLQYPL